MNDLSLLHDALARIGVLEREVKALWTENQQLQTRLNTAIRSISAVQQRADIKLPIASGLFENVEMHGMMIDGNFFVLGLDLFTWFDAKAAGSDRELPAANRSTSDRYYRHFGRGRDEVIILPLLEVAAKYGTTGPVLRGALAITGATRLTLINENGVREIKKAAPKLGDWLLTTLKEATVAAAATHRPVIKGAPK